MSNFTTAAKVAVAILGASNSTTSTNLADIHTEPLKGVEFSRNWQSIEKTQKRYDMWSLRNPQVSLRSDKSGEYAEHLQNFATKLNGAIDSGTSVSPYIDAEVAKTYAKMCRRCENSFEVLLLSRALPYTNGRVTAIATPDMKSEIPQVVSFSDCLNSKISLDRNKSGEYSKHLSALVTGLNYAIEKGTSLSPYIDKHVAQEYYTKLAQKCENSFELMVLTRSLPSEAVRYAYKVNGIGN